MTATHKNRVQMTVTSVAGSPYTITLNAASSGYQSLGTAYAANATVDILITQGTAWEVARNCAYTHVGTTVTRGTFEASSTGSVITTFDNTAVVSVTLSADKGNSLETLMGAFGLDEIAVTGTVTATLGRMHHCTGTSANYTVTLPAASGNTGKLIGFRMGSAAGLTKLVTIDGNASETIDGATTRVMWATETAILLCDGSNWHKIAGKSKPMIAAMHLAADQTGVVSGVSTKATIDTTDLNNTGLMADTTNKRINIVRAGSYLTTAQVRMDILTATAISTQIWKNGAQISSAIGSTPTDGYFGMVAFFPVTLEVSDYIEAAGFHNKGTNHSFMGGAVSDGNTNMSVTEVPQW